MPGTGSGWHLETPEPCCSKGIALSRLAIHLLPPLFLLLGSDTTIKTWSLPGGWAETQTKGANAPELPGVKHVRGVIMDPGELMVSKLLALTIQGEKATEPKS